jgi:myo-inositol-1(or 4)-monophosphatase
MDDLTLAREAAEAGAVVLRRRFGNAGAASYKQADDPVTETDKAAEAAILAFIHGERPDDAVLSEEGEAADPAAIAGRTWIVDPLDGTVNYMSGIPQVAVSIALYDGLEPLLGVVVDPFREEVFTATAGGGAYLDDEPIAVSDTTDFGRAVIATGFPYDHKEHAAGYAHVLEGVLAEVQGIRRFGSAALDLAWVAAGRFDGFYELGLSAWDLAAGVLLITEAGGLATTPGGAPLTPAERLVVVGTPQVHEPLRAIIAARLPDHVR